MFANKGVAFFNSQVRQLRIGGYNVLWKKILKTLDLITFVPIVILFLPVIIFVRLIKPFFLIRFGSLMFGRIGHYILMTELLLQEIDAGLRPRGFDFFYERSADVCNKQAQRIWRRILKVSPIVRYFTAGNRVIPGYKDHSIIFPNDRDVHDLLHNSKPYFSLSREEEDFGWREMDKIGISKNERFVCFHARDPAYLKVTQSAFDWAYHNCRDSKIETYLPATEELTRRRYFCIRMGAVVEKPINGDNDRIVDYAVKHRTDFLDIFILSKCFFFLSSSGGIFNIPMLSKRPILWVNFLPIQYAFTWSENSMFVPKKLWSRKEQRVLTFREIFKEDLSYIYSSHEFAARGIDVVDNTPEEIFAATCEMDDRLNGRWIESDSDRELQKMFWSIFRADPKLHGKMRIRIGSDFLKDNIDLLN